MSLHQGGKLKYLIANQSKTNAEIASLSGIAESTLYNYFNQSEINYKKLKKICEVLGISYKNNFEPDENDNFKVSESDAPYGWKERFEASERENEILRKQVNQLEEIIDLMKRKKK